MNRRALHRRRRAAVAALALLPACRSYTPVPANELRLGQPARVRLTERGSLDLATLIGPRGRAVDGRIVSRDDRELVVAVSDVLRASGDEEPWTGERVRIPLDAVDDVRSPRLSRARSGLLAGAVVAGALVLARALGGTEPNTSGGGPSGPGAPR